MFHPFALLSFTILNSQSSIPPYNLIDPCTHLLPLPLNCRPVLTNNM